MENSVIEHPDFSLTVKNKNTVFLINHIYSDKGNLEEIYMNIMLSNIEKL